MDSLTVLYDSTCTFCVACRHFLEARAQHTFLRFVCCRSAEARARFGTIAGLGDELVVVDAHGRYWVGPPAFLICLWALVGGRLLSWLLATALFWPLTRATFATIEAYRGTLSSWFGTSCEGQHCGVTPRHAPYR